jgi:hypothetical protein
MPGFIDPQHTNPSNLPTIWSPVQWELTDEQRADELDNQATASLLWSADILEAVLRLLLNETEIERAYEPPEGYDPEQQGEWDESLLTFQFKRPIKIEKFEQRSNGVYIEYQFGGLGHWAIDITPDEVNIRRL